MTSGQLIENEDEYSEEVRSSVTYMISAPQIACERFARDTATIGCFRAINKFLEAFYDYKYGSGTCAAVNVAKEEVDFACDMIIPEDKKGRVIDCSNDPKEHQPDFPDSDVFRTGLLFATEIASRLPSGKPSGVK